MFVPYNRVWWAEYKVMFEALKALGYEVEVRSSADGSAYSYQLDTDVQNSANTLTGSSYSAFTSQFQRNFGIAWNSAWNTPAQIPISGRIQDVTSMNSYEALVIAGGDGAISYLYDGAYAANSDPSFPSHVSTQSEVQAASVQLNTLMSQALTQGKPVLSQCHGGTLPAFARIPSTVGQGSDFLGLSILAGRGATAFHTNATQGAGTLTANGDSATRFAQMGVTYRVNEAVVVESPSASWTASPPTGAKAKIITSRDWLPQTVSHAARTLVNILQTTPSDAVLAQSKSVLVIHGGLVDSTSASSTTVGCNYQNRNNDIPCNYGISPSDRIPADAAQIESLLASTSAGDGYSVQVTLLNISAASPPVNLSDRAAVLNYLNGFDAVIFFKHWATSMSLGLQQGIVDYARDGGGVIALHHGLYNESNSKDFLVQNLFLAHSASSPTWSARSPYASSSTGRSADGSYLTSNRTAPADGSFAVFQADLGNFITTHRVSYASAPLALPAGLPASVNSVTVPFANPSSAQVGYFPISDEIYNNMSFLSGATAPVFGRGVGEHNILFANNYVSQAAQVYTTGFTRLYNPDGNASVGRVAYFSIGERRANFAVGSAYGQVVRNAVQWASKAR